MEPVPKSEGRTPTGPVRPTDLPLNLGVARPFDWSRRRRRSKSQILSASLLGAGALCLPLVAQPVHAADGNSTNNAAATDVQVLREQVTNLEETLKKVQAELAKVKAEEEKNAAGLTNNANEYVKQEDLDALKDVVDEQLLRDVGTRTSSKAKGNNLVALGGGGIFRFSDLISKSHNFSIPSATLSLSGALRDDPTADGNVAYTVSVLGATGTDTSSSLALSDVFLQWDIKTAKLELEPDYTLSLRAGQQLVPYGLDNINGELARPTIYTAQYLSGIPTSSGPTFGRDIGVAAQGGFFNHSDPTGGATLNPLSGNTVASAVNPIFGYTVGVFNGAGANKLVGTNNSIAFVGKFLVNPFPSYFSNFRNLSFGFDYYEGNLGPKGLPTKRRYGPEFQWLRKPFLFTFEQVHSEDGFDEIAYSTTSGRGKGPNGWRTSDSYVATLFWTPGTLPDLQPWVRFDYFKPSWRTITTPAYNSVVPKRIYTVGLNYFIYQVEPVVRRVYDTTATERVIKIQLAYDYIDYEGKNLGGNHRITGQVVYSF